MTTLFASVLARHVKSFGNQIQNKIRPAYYIVGPALSMVCDIYIHHIGSRVIKESIKYCYICHNSSCSYNLNAFGTFIKRAPFGIVATAKWEESDPKLKDIEDSSLLVACSESCHFLPLSSSLA